jgi:hypothetical protein
MADEIVNQVEGLFSDKEQWTSFLELASQKDFIIESWWQTFRPTVHKCFAIDNFVDDWSFKSWGYWDFRWFIKEFEEKSLSLWSREWNGNYSLVLWADANLFDVVKISDLLEEPKYQPIVSAFERLDEIANPVSDVKILEHGNYQFGDSMDGHIDFKRLAWYAHYKKEEFVCQILRKIDRFRKDKEVTDLFKEINTLTQKRVS